MLQEEHGIPCVGVPGTIDNDLYGTDYTIGFQTAVSTAVECVDKLRDTAESHERLFLIEVMGRHSGAIAAVVGLACGAEEVLVPEEKTDLKRVRKMLEYARKQGKKSCIVIVAEGDDEGGAFAIRDKLALTEDFDIRVAILGHIQRGGIPVAFDRILASTLGYAAVDRLMKGRTGIMVGIRNWEVSEVPLHDTFSRKESFEYGLLDIMRVLST
jgi:6-phosphofructokinase 1